MVPPFAAISFPVTALLSQPERRIVPGKRTGTPRPHGVFAFARTGPGQARA